MASCLDDQGQVKAHGSTWTEYDCRHCQCKVQQAFRLSRYCVCCVSFLRDGQFRKVSVRRAEVVGRVSVWEILVLGRVRSTRLFEHLMLVGRNGRLDDEYRSMNTRDDAITTDVHSFQSINPLTPHYCATVQPTCRSSSRFSLALAMDPAKYHTMLSLSGHGVK